MSGADEQDSTCTLPPTTFVPTPGAGLDGISVGIPMVCQYFEKLYAVLK